jgi:hypothetical protein
VEAMSESGQRVRGVMIHDRGGGGGDDSGQRRVWWRSVRTGDQSRQRRGWRR